MVLVELSIRSPFSLADLARLMVDVIYHLPVWVAIWKVLNFDRLAEIDSIQMSRCWLSNRSTTLSDPTSGSPPAYRNVFLCETSADFGRCAHNLVFPSCGQVSCHGNLIESLHFSRNV